MNDYLHSRIDEQGRAMLCLNRPEKHNAFDDRLIAVLTRKLQELEADPQVRLVVLTAACTARGTAFSASTWSPSGQMEDPCAVSWSS